MKHIIEKGSFKTSMYIFILTGTFLIGLFGYPLFDHLQNNEFNSVFPGDWDKVIGVVIGIYLIFRSSIFKVRSRDLFFEITDRKLRYRMDRNQPIKEVERSDIENFEVKKGKVTLITKYSKRLMVVDFENARMRDEKRKAIIDNLKQELNS